ncbi:T-cell ecto-ADP-ribosyltransferase 1 [Liparis tanakae]|uniref:NAD(P)(+)--arginine ADP-ribosyltransferase n=1 Tax=Liparis tanakae TaxID=230148 RepID=A0A4Z2G7Z1_9TELE|nr:T-cell ecto-ADP-ribosyltransferase 1 [Liparis tanakae]
MKGIVRMFAPICLLLCWMLPVCSKLQIRSLVRRPEADRMSMEGDAVDDMYCRCNETMAKRIKDKYFKKENKGEFAKAWKREKECVNARLKLKQKGDEALTRDHIQAICVYTGLFSKTLNDAVRKGKSTYRTSFPYHSLHFWLTSAIQILSNTNCLTSYRRTDRALRGSVNQIMRFGSFASSSEEKTLKKFGKKTCFEIQTCYGAFLNHSSSIGREEKEVLIPPYEQFKIVKETKGRNFKGLEDCEVVYTLKSAGIESNLNCNAV